MLHPVVTGSVRLVQVRTGYVILDHRYVSLWHVKPGFAMLGHVPTG